MASRRRAAQTPVEQSNTFSPPVGNYILRAWQGLYHLSGPRATFQTSPEGITVVNLTVDEKWDVNALLDVLVKNDKARLPLFPLYIWIMGVAPESFSSSAELTAWQTQNIE